MNESAPGGTIRIVAAVVLDVDGRSLLVRKHGSRVFQQPGGKRDAADRDDLETLARELREELGCTLVAHSAQWLCRGEAPAANERGCMMEAEVYRVQLAEPPQAQAEIAELRWVDPAAARDDPEVAMLSRHLIMPLLAPSRS